MSIITILLINYFKVVIWLGLYYGYEVKTRPKPRYGSVDPW